MADIRSLDQDTKGLTMTLPEGQSLEIITASGTTIITLKGGELVFDGSYKITTDTTEKWYRHGTQDLHRANGQPAYIDYGTKYHPGSTRWYKDGNLHRLDGPAYIDSREESWYKNNKRHRVGGPARIECDPHCNPPTYIYSYYLEGRNVTMEEAMSA